MKNMIIPAGEETASLRVAKTVAPAFSLMEMMVVMLVVAVIGCAPVKAFVKKFKEQENCRVKSKSFVVMDITLYVLAFITLAWCMIRLSSGAYNPFIYFKF